MLYEHTISLMTNHFNMHSILIAGLKLPSDWAIASNRRGGRGSNNNNNDNL